MPAVIRQIRIPSLELRHYQVYLVLYRVRVNHRVLAVMVVLMIADLAVLVYQRVGMCLAPVVYRRMHQRVQAAPLARGHRHYWYAQHLREAVHIYLHAALLHDVHHVQCHDYRLTQLQQLQGEIEAALERARVHDVYYDVHIAAEDEVAGNRLLHRVARQRVGARQIHEVDVHALEAHMPLYLLDRDARPVGHLQVRARVGVEERRLAAVRVADETYSHRARSLIGHRPSPPPLLCCA